MKTEFRADNSDTKCVKKEIIRDLAIKLNMPDTTAEMAVETVLTRIKSAILEGRDVILNNYFNIQVVKGKQKIGRNIGSGTALVIPARFRAKIKLAAKLEKDLQKSETAAEICQLKLEKKAKRKRRSGKDKVNA